MPSKKSLRIQRSNAARNKPIRTFARSRVALVLRAIDSGEPYETVQKLALAAISSLDRAHSKGVIHKNNASRRKSRLMRRVNSLQA